MRFKYDANIRDSRRNAFVPTIKAIEATIRKWRCETTINLGDDVMQTVPYSEDSVDCNIAYVRASALDSGVVMKTTHKFSYCRNGVGPAASIFVYITAIDIAINAETLWSYDLSATPIPRDSVRVDFKTSLLHELGHGIGLDHVADPNACMYPSISPYEQRYYLSTEPELNGGANILRRSTATGRCYPPMVALTSANCTGAQLTLSQERFIYYPCNPPSTFSVTASGASIYKWYPASAFSGTNPTTKTVSFSSANDAPFVYGMRDGLGDYIRTFYKRLNCFPGKAEPSGELRTAVYPNPTRTTFTVAYKPATSAEQLAVTLYNAQGTTVFSQLWEGAVAGITQKYQLPQVPAGTYFLRTVVNGRAGEVMQLQVE